VVKTNKMKIKKTNGKTASKKIHLLADAVLETSISNTWLLSDEMKKEILINLGFIPTKSNESKQINKFLLNQQLSTYIALKSWYSGCYGDFDLDYNSVEDYFIQEGYNL